jgi:hypothetical protein
MTLVVGIMSFDISTVLTVFQFDHLIINCSKNYNEKQKPRAVGTVCL